MSNLSDAQVALLWARCPNQWVRDMFGVRPSNQQDELLEAYAQPNAHVTVRSGHGVGKTSALAWCIMHFLTFMNVCHDPGCLSGDTKIPCTAPSGHQLMDLLWPEVLKWLGKMREPFPRPFRVVGEEVRFLTGRDVGGNPEFRCAVARTSRKENPEALQGFHATNMLFLIDEASGVPEEVFEVAEGALSTPGAKVIMTSNPTKVNGFFWLSHQPSEAKRWKQLAFSCWDSDSPTVDKGYAESMLRRYGENSPIYRVRVLGEFPKANERSLISMESVQAALDRDMEKSGARVAALDVGRGGDPSALVCKHGGVYWKLRRWYTDDTTEVVGTVHEMWKAGDFETLYVDSIGLGGPVADRLRQMGLSVFDVNVAEAVPHNAGKFMRMRDQLWWNLSERFRDGVVGIDPGCADAKTVDDFVAELTLLEYEDTVGGKIKVEGKKELKKRLGKYGQSPNMADAAMMCEAAGVVGSTRNRARRQRMEVRRVARAW